MPPKPRKNNRSKQLNPNNDAYWQSRGHADRPFMAMVDPPKSGSSGNKKRGKNSRRNGR